MSVFGPTRFFILIGFFAAFLPAPAGAVESPTGLVMRSGDQSVVLHWNRSTDPAISGYRIYRAPSSTGAFTLVAAPATPRFCDVSVANNQTYRYRVTAIAHTIEESFPSAIVTASPRPFASDDEFLDYVQQTGFDFFWYGANPDNGLVPDRTAAGAPCSIAAVGFGLSAICVGIDHDWISRQQGAQRVLTTLNTFLNGPQGPAASGVMGYKGWFYHFLDMNTARRSGDTELSSIDTGLLLGSVVDVRQYFDQTNSVENALREQASAILNRVDWNWMARGTDVLSMGWFPGSGFLSANWIGYNEAMILCILGLGASTNPLPATAWSRWTSGYTWANLYGQNHVPFPPLFGHQYSHCWIDFRHIADPYMLSRRSTYFENSRRATLAQRAYAIANPLGHAGYGSNVWGFTACDGVTGYAARGAPNGFDDGTIAPTAAGASIPFTPEYSVPALRHFYAQYRPRIWSAYGFRDAFNPGAQWFATDVIGIDQGPIVLMIENYRTQRVWRRFMQAQEVQRGLQGAGFVSLRWMNPAVQSTPSSNAISLTWSAPPGRVFGVEYSPDLLRWFSSPKTVFNDLEPSLTWDDTGPPATPTSPFTTPQRFYRVFQFGAP